MDFDNRLLIIACVNGLAFSVFIWDKLKSKWKGRRTPERVLLLLTLAGGEIGAVFAMVLVRHKTSKRSFLWKFYLCFLLGITLSILFLRA